MYWISSYLRVYTLMKQNFLIRFCVIEIFGQIVMIFNNKEENLRIYDDPWICHWLCCYIICLQTAGQMLVHATNVKKRCILLLLWRLTQVLVHATVTHSFFKRCICCCYKWCGNVKFCNQCKKAVTLGWTVVLVDVYH